MNATTAPAQTKLAAAMAAADEADAAERTAYAAWVELDAARAIACGNLQAIERRLTRAFLKAKGTPAELEALDANLVVVETVVDRAFRTRDES